MTALPVLELAFGPIGNAPVEDPNTKEGKMWHDIFHDVTEVSGFQRVGWSRRIDKLEINMFAVYWDSYIQHHNFMEQYGTLSAPIMNLLTGDFDMYHIHPSTQDLAYLHTRHTSVAFFWGVNDAIFGPAFKTFVSAIERSPACVGTCWGSIMTPARRDSTGNLELGEGASKGKGVCFIGGWKSTEEHDSQMAGREVLNAIEGLRTGGEGFKKLEVMPYRFNVVEKSKDTCEWRRL